MRLSFTARGAGTSPPAVPLPSQGNTEREESVYLAKLAEQAERYDEMVEEMKKVCR